MPLPNCIENSEAITPDDVRWQKEEKETLERWYKRSEENRLKLLHRARDLVTQWNGDPPVFAGLRIEVQYNVCQDYVRKRDAETDNEWKLIYEGRLRRAMERLFELVEEYDK